MRALLLLALLTMPSAEAQYVPNRVATFGAVSSRASMFRYALDPHSGIGPTNSPDSPQVSTFAVFLTMRIQGPGNRGIPLIARVCIEHLNAEDAA